MIVSSSLLTVGNRQMKCSVKYIDKHRWDTTLKPLTADVNDIIATMQQSAGNHSARSSYFDVYLPPKGCSIHNTTLLWQWLSGKCLKTTRVTLIKEPMELTQDTKNAVPTSQDTPRHRLYISQWARAVYVAQQRPTLYIRHVVLMLWLIGDY